MSDFRPIGGAPSGRPQSLTETLENDAAALAVLVRLADYASHCRPEDEGIAAELAELYRDGAGGTEPDAVLAWARQRLTEVETTLAALDGSGAPFAASSGIAYLIEQIEAVRISHDLGTRSSALLDGAAAVLRTWKGGSRE